MIYHPEEFPPAKHDSKKHPKWINTYNKYHFVEPNANNTLGFWDGVRNKPYLFNHGFLFVNPNVENNWEFDDNPNAEPFKAKPKLKCK